MKMLFKIMMAIEASQTTEMITAVPEEDLLGSQGFASMWTSSA